MFHKRPNVTQRPRRTLPDSYPDSMPLICVLTTSTTPHSEGYLSTHRRYSFTAALYTQCVRANNRFDTQNTPTSARSHNNINSVIHINLITMNNASLSHNSTYVRLLQERTLNDPDFPRHHTRSPPVNAAISHGDHETAQVTPNHCLRTVSPTNIRCTLSHVYDRYIYTCIYKIIVYCVYVVHKLEIKIQLQK